MIIEVDNKINIENVKKDLSDFIECSRFPLYSDKSTKRVEMILKICCIVECVIAGGWFYSILQDLLGFARFFAAVTIGFTISFITSFLCDIIIIEEIKSKKNKEDLLERINQITTYEDLSSVITYMGYGYEKTTKKCNHGFYDFSLLESNIDDFNDLTSENILNVSCKINKKLGFGQIDIKLHDDDGSVFESKINVMVRENSTLEKPVITIYPYTNIQLDIPYSNVPYYEDIDFTDIVPYPDVDWTDIIQKIDKVVEKPDK